MAERIQLRRDTSADWAATNPVLANGELGVEEDTEKFKLGDGVNAWNTLGYWNGIGGTPLTLEAFSSTDGLLLREAGGDHDYVKVNLAGAGAPAASDDETAGYRIGSLWLYQNQAWICTVADEDTAVWKELTPVGAFTEIASQAEAEVGAENSKGMTPLRTKEAITAQVASLAMTEDQMVRADGNGDATAFDAANLVSIAGLTLAAGTQLLGSAAETLVVRDAKVSLTYHIPGDVEAVTDFELLYAAFPFDITRIRYAIAQGDVDVTVKIDGTVVTGINALSVDSATKTVAAISSNNAVAVDKPVTITASGLNGSPKGLIFQIDGTRT